MGQQQFEYFQSQVIKLSPQQLKALQNQIEGKLTEQHDELLTDEEVSLISSLFQ